MFRKYVYWLLFLSSYSPLLLILMVRSWGNWWIFGTLAVSAVGAAMALLWALHSARQLNPEPYGVSAVATRSSEVTGYIASYIIPFVLVDFYDWKDLLALALLFLLVGYVYVRSDLIYINPTLNFFGYGMYAVQGPTGSEHILIAKRKPSVGQIRAHPFSGSVIVEAC